MIVKPRPNTDEVKKRINLGQLALEKNYIVYSLSINYHNREVWLTIMSDDDETPVMYLLQNFIVIDNKIPNNWSLNILNKDFIRLGPDEFSGNFWDEYHDADRDAERIFVEVNNKIADFHNRPDLMMDYEEPPLTARDLLKKQGLELKD